MRPILATALQPQVGVLRALQPQVGVLRALQPARGETKKREEPARMATYEPAPADAHEILPRLWLGNAKASMDAPFLRQNQIQVVFNCTKNYPFSPSIPIPYRVPVDDNLKEEEIRNMELWSSEVAYRILSEYQQGRTILVHCAAGIQRSAASVAFFLIAYRSMRAHEAIAFIQSRRPIAFRPRPNFLRAIESFDRRFHSEILPELQHSHYE